MSVFEEMHPRYSFESLRDYNELKRILSETIERGFVEEVPVMIARPVPSRAERWDRDKETGEIYSLTPPEESRSRKTTGPIKMAHSSVKDGN
jgi:hypothetical protein